VRATLPLACSIAALALASASRAGDGAAAPCTPRVGEKLGVRFVELCATSGAAPPDAGRHAEAALPAFWIAATPLPCSQGEQGTVGCDRVTALEDSALPGPGKNQAMDALVVDAFVAHRACALRFGGRLPTPLERERAREQLGLASLLVRRTDGPPERVRLDDLPEWVEEGDCAAAPSNPGPGCRITPFPPVIARPRADADVLLSCHAARAGAQASAVPIGSECDERLAKGARNPQCTVAVPGSPARFELFCDPEPATRSGAPAVRTDQAAFRCVLPESALGRVGLRTGW
jgi:hypothetical protein